MRILVTGATGFIGKHVVDFFKNKYDVVGLSRSEEFLEKNVCIVKTDYSINHLCSLMDGCDAIIHLAAARPIRLNEVNFQDNTSLDFKIFSAADHKKIKNIVFISTRGVYGNQKTPWVESLPVLPNDFYALAKAQSELIASFFIRKGLNIKILRIAQLLGVGEYEGSAIQVFIESAALNKPIEITVEGIKREYLYIKDLLSALDKSVQAFDKHGIYNVGSGELISLAQMAHYISAAFDRVNLVDFNIQKYIEEAALMDSTLFQKEFGWKPRFNFEKASIDISNKFGR